MNYIKLRWQIYQNELKQLIASIGQLFTFVTLMLYLALPIMIFMPLVWLSIIADIQTSQQDRVLYQWSYFILLFCLIRIQRKAILASKFQHFLASYSQSTAIKAVTTCLISLVAGNLLILAPMLLSFYIPNWQVFWQQLHFPLFAMLTWLIAYAAIIHTRIPWLSLVLMPVGLLFLSSHLVITAPWLNVIVLFVMGLEILFQPLAKIKPFSLSTKHYWQVRLVALISSPANAIIRIFILVVLVSLLAYVQQQMSQVAEAYLQVMFCWLLALLLGSFQFDNEAFYQQYELFLASLLSSSTIRYITDIFPIILLAVLVAVVLQVKLGFYAFCLVLLPIGTLMTVITTSKYQRNFFIVPSIFFIVLAMLV
ncbi:DUF6136 family protein [Litorilituus lipolyticus]|uniref:Uncharacterized protein n=1 Tax=Litorilituus lipolyticus TaxID=2491017 RepID=A0A502KVH1_9GAMM|nr:DUF6136 family protein [Litorilituus lipolyticus]TPH15572.1 hypothetical protein EPA86_08300 [Litorilituus lipolyticus]